MDAGSLCLSCADDDIVGIHDVHVSKNVAPIDEKSGCRIVARRCGVARRRFVDAIGPYRTYCIQKQIISVV